jgi:hypothetical protein
VRREHRSPAARFSRFHRAPLKSSSRRSSIDFAFGWLSRKLKFRRFLGAIFPLQGEFIELTSIQVPEKQHFS